MNLLIALILAASPVGWRTDGTGRYPDATPPLEWSADRNVVWKTSMPAPSNATPVVVGYRIFVCAEPSTLVCVDARSGKIRWQKTHDYTDVEPPVQQKAPKRHNTNGYSSPTPVTDGKTVYVLFGTGVAAAYDLDGKRRWIRFVDAPNHGWGHSASPVLVGNKLIVSIRDMRALSVADGSRQWRIDMAPRWGTPIAHRIGTTDVLITPSGKVVKAADGTVLVGGLGSLTYNAPLVEGDTTYFIDGERKTKATRLVGPAGSAFMVDLLWQARIAKNRYYASPVLHNGIVYAVNQRGAFTTIDAESGEVIYEQKLQLGGTVYPSIALAGGYLFVSSDSGKTFIIEPGREYKKLGENQLGTFRASPVFIRDRLFIRTMKHLYCIAQPQQTARTDP